MDDLPLTAPPASGSGSNLPEYTVSELSLALKRSIEDEFGQVRVRGEISGFKRPGSGHWYFALKDAEAVLDAVCWRTTAIRLALKPEDGMEVVCSGRLTTYPGRSKYQLVVDTIDLAGKGALLRLLEERRLRLAAEGLFAAERKQLLPFLPEVIGIVTSPSGAVIRDILHRLADRFPRHVLIWPVAVQGEGAAAQVAAAIDGFNRIAAGGPVPRPDLIIVARGGGSLEDLMAFNEETVVRAAAASLIPLISAVGHETDTTLIDYASDRRAPTPSAAAEMAVPVRLDLIAEVAAKSTRLARGLARFLAEARIRLEGFARGLPDPLSVIETKRQNLDDRAERLDHGLAQFLRARRERLATLAAHVRPAILQTEIDQKRQRFGDFPPRLHQAMARLIERQRRMLEASAGRLESHRLALQQALERGYAIVRDAAGGVVTAAAAVAPGAALSLEFHDGKVDVVVARAPRRGQPKAPKREQGRLL